MLSNLPISINPSALSLKGSDITVDEPHYFCLPYHCPCPSHRSGPLPGSIVGHQESVWAPGITTELNDLFAREVVGKEKTYDDDGQATRICGERDYEYDLYNLTVPNGSSASEPIKGFNPDDFINWSGTPPKSPPILTERVDNETLIKYLEAARAESRSFLEPLQPSTPHFTKNACTAEPSPSQLPTLELPPVPPPAQALAHQPVAFGTPAQARPHREPTAPFPSFPRQFTSGLTDDKIIEHGTASSLQPRLDFPQAAAPQFQLATASRLLSTHLASAPQTESVPAHAPIVKPQVPPSVGTYHPASTIPAQRIPGPIQPLYLHAPIPMRAFVPPPVASPNPYTATALQQRPFDAAAYNLHYAQLSTTAISHLRQSLEKQLPSPAADSIPMTSTRPPTVPLHPSFQQRVLEFRARAGSIRNVNEDTQRPTEQHQTQLYAMQVSRLSDSRVPKRSFEHMVTSDPSYIATTSSKPAKRQQIQRPIPAAQVQHSFLSSSSSQPNPPSLTQPAENQFTVPAAPTAMMTHSEAGPSTRMSDISNTVNVGKLSSRPSSKRLAYYKRFMGNTYSCAWDGCGVALSVGAYQEDRNTFEMDVLAHLEGHLPKLATDEALPCRWLVGNSAPCSGQPKALKGIIRHIYGCHQTSKGKCDNCQTEFSRAEEYNKHIKECYKRRVVGESTVT